MSKQKTPKLADFSRQSSSQLIVSINLAAVVFMLIGLFTIFTNRESISPTSLIIAILLILLSMVSVIFSTVLLLRKSKNAAIERGNKSVDWTISLPAKQKEKLNREVGEIARIMDIPGEQYSDLLLAYIVAEDLALRQIQQEAAQPLIRHAKIGETEFDAILLTDNLITCIEVTFLVSPEIAQEKIDLIGKKMIAAQKIVENEFPNSNLKLSAVVVTQLDAMGEAKLRSIAKDKFSSIPVKYFEISLYSFEELQKIFTM